MNIKVLEIPFDILQLAAGSRRVTPKHEMKPQIVTDHNLKYAGFYGEKEIYYFLQLLPHDKFYFFHNIRLKINNTYFQIDFLILTVKFALILEVKNYRGQVYFNEFNQLVLIKNDKEDSLQDPISQVDRHQLQLSNWLTLNKFPQIPIYTFVVFSSSTTLLKSHSVNPDLHNKIISGSNILPTILNLDKNISKQVLSKSYLIKLSTQIIKYHTPLKLNMMQRYKLSKNNISKGMHCPICSAIPLIKVKKKWFCQSCNYFGKNNFKKSLYDYALLIDDQVSNKDAREFLNIESENTMKYFLKNSGFKYTGKNKSRKYLLE